MTKTTDLVFFERKSDLKEFLETAKVLGTMQLILAKNFSKNELKELKQFVEKNFPEKNFQFCQVLEKANPNELKEFRQLVNFIAVQGKSISLNKFAVSQKNIDFLLQPFGSGKLEFDTAIARLAKENNVKIVFLFKEFNSVQGLQKSLLLKNTLFVIKLLKRFKVEPLFFSGAKEVIELRSLKDLSSFAVMLGFSLEQGKKFILHS